MVSLRDVLLSLAILNRVMQVYQLGQGLGPVCMEDWYLDHRRKTSCFSQRDKTDEAATIDVVVLDSVSEHSLL